MPRNWMTHSPLTWGQWISLYCVLSFAILGLDAGMNHYEVIHENAWSYTPIIFAPLAVLFCLGCLLSYGWRRAAWVIGVLALIVGGAGTLFHNLPTLEFRHGATVWHALLTAGRPPLAPAAFASTGLLMLLVSWAAHWREPCVEESANATANGVESKTR